MTELLEPNAAVQTDDAGNPKAGRGRPRGHSNKPVHPSVANGVKMDEFPSAEERKKFQPLKAEDFSAKGLPAFLRHKAAQYEAKARDLHAEAKIVEQTGAVGDTKTVKQVIDLRDQIKALQEKLIAEHNFSPEAVAEVMKNIGAQAA